MPIGEQNQGAEGAAKGVTSTVSSTLSCGSVTPISGTDQCLQIGNLAGGVSKTVGGVVGSAGQGLSIYETQTNVI